MCVSGCTQAHTHVSVAERKWDFNVSYFAKVKLAINEPISFFFFFFFFGVNKFVLIYNIYIHSHTQSQASVTNTLLCPGKGSIILQAPGDSPEGAQAWQSSQVTPKVGGHFY